MTEDADVVAEVGELRGQLRELAGSVAEIGGDLAEQRDTLSEMAQTLDELVAKVSPEEHRQVDWRPHKLDRTRARAEWDRLCSWLAEIAPIYDLTREEVPDCWTRHPRLRNELSWLRVAFEQSMRPDALASAAAEWHTRHLVAARLNCAEVARRTGCAGPRHRDDRPPPDEGTLAEITSREHWDQQGIEEDVAERPAFGAE